MASRGFSAAEPAHVLVPKMRPLLSKDYTFLPSSKFNLPNMPTKYTNIKKTMKGWYSPCSLTEIHA